jgi:hypothetical protein
MKNQISESIDTVNDALNGKKVNEDVSLGHTLGPWEVVNTKQGKSFIKPINNAVYVAEVNTENKSHEANAHLIVAAPELLEACKLAFERLTDNDAMKIIGYDLVNVISKAISKAEGK